jgi:hypothetical protein
MSKFPIQLLLTFLVPAALLPFLGGCVTSNAHRKVLTEYRELERRCDTRLRVLERENKVLYEEKLERERLISDLRHAIEDTAAQLIAEKEAFKTYKASTRRKIAALQEQVAQVEQQAGSRVARLNKMHRQTVDSLVLQIDSLSTRLVDQRKTASAQIRTLRDSLSAEKLQCDKEIYALKTLKSELFEKIQEKEVRIQELLLLLRSAAEIDTVSEDTTENDTAHVAPPQ